MEDIRILILGNSGSGKTTLARELAQQHQLPVLDLDALAWSAPGVRRPLAETAAEMDAFLTENPRWVAEGCYGDLLEMLAPYAREMIFLNPGVDVCVRNCRTRPWEPDKYPSREEQDRMLDYLISWVREYETRNDEFSLARHRAIFHSFAGQRREITNPGGEASGATGPLNRLGMALVPFLLALSAACATAPDQAVVDSQWQREVGWIMQDESLGGVIQMPDTVRLNTPVVATVVTRGSSSCTRADGAEVAGGGAMLRVTPYDRVAPAGTPCTRDLAAFPRQVELRFTAAGSAEVVVVGRGSLPDPTPVQVTRRVTVIP